MTPYLKVPVTLCSEEEIKWAESFSGSKARLDEVWINIEGHHQLIYKSEVIK